VDTTTDSPVSVRDLREHMADCLGRVRAGETLVVLSHGRPVARLVPVRPKRTRAEVFGALKGRVRIAADFDADDQHIIAAADAPIDP
jgi:prevent-host-death family protein